MRKTLSLLVLAAGCASGPGPEERESEVYDRIAYLRVSYDTAYGDYNRIAIDAIAQELRRHANRELELFCRDVKAADLRRKSLAAFALAFATEKKAQEALLVGVRDKNHEIVEMCLAALGILHMSDTPIDVFREHLTSPIPGVRQAALYGLRFHLDEGEPRGMLTEVVRLLTDATMEVRNEALILLRRMRTKEIVDPILRHCVKDRDPLIRQNAAISLAALGAEAVDATAALVEMLRDGDTKVVEAAWTALNRIHGKDFDRSYQTWRDWWEDEEKKAEYVCLEHEDVIAPIPGQCPKCLKRLVRQPKPEDYLCPVHADVRMKKEGRCSVTNCRRTLVAFRPQYVCANHPESKANRPGPCPQCQKDRKPLRETFVCPEHADVEAPRTGKCSRCEKDLVPKKE
jgi:hypothetical protein